MGAAVAVEVAGRGYLVLADEAGDDAAGDATRGLLRPAGPRRCRRTAGPAIAVAAGDALRRGVRTADRGDDADALEGGVTPSPVSRVSSEDSRTSADAARRA